MVNVKIWRSGDLAISGRWRGRDVGCHDVEVVKWRSGEVAKWRWGDGAMGRWDDVAIF
jgi:hypothetical protein